MTDKYFENLVDFLRGHNVVPTKPLAETALFKQITSARTLREGYFRGEQEEIWFDEEGFLTLISEGFKTVNEDDDVYSYLYNLLDYEESRELKGLVLDILNHQTNIDTLIVDGYGNGDLLFTNDYSDTDLPYIKTVVIRWADTSDPAIQELFDRDGITVINEMEESEEESDEEESKESIKLHHTREIERLKALIYHHEKAIKDLERDA